MTTILYTRKGVIKYKTERLRAILERCRFFTCTPFGIKYDMSLFDIPYDIEQQIYIDISSYDITDTMDYWFHRHLYNDPSRENNNFYWVEIIVKDHKLDDHLYEYLLEFQRYIPREGTYYINISFNNIIDKDKALESVITISYPKKYENVINGGSTIKKNTDTQLLYVKFLPNSNKTSYQNAITKYMYNILHDIQRIIISDDKYILITYISNVCLSDISFLLACNGLKCTVDRSEVFEHMSELCITWNL